MDSSCPVLCLSAERVNERFGSGFVVPTLDTLVSRTLSHGIFVSRDIAESSDDLKQVCTYTVISHEDRIFVYQRGVAGDESRLHGQLSLGVGGHVEQSDFMRWAGVYEFGVCRQAALREIKEEVHFLAGATTPEFIGIVNENETEVGRRHVGLVYKSEVKSDESVIREESVGGASFWQTDEIMGNLDRFEKWSQIVATALLGKSE